MSPPPSRTHRRWKRSGLPLPRLWRLGWLRRIGRLRRLLIPGRLRSLVRAVGKAWVGHRIAGVRHRRDGGLPGRSGFIEGRSETSGLLGMTNALRSPPGQRNRAAMVPRDVLQQPAC
jgi:hypothetical protein